VDEVVGQKSFISNEDITRLSFTSMLIKETLRRYAIAPSIMRVVRKETTIDGIRLPAGTPMMVNLYHLQYNSVNQYNSTYQYQGNCNWL